MEYMTRTDPNAFLDYPPKREKRKGEVECPKCLGHGGWNLQLNAYALKSKHRDHADTPENRHFYSHFRASCDQCNGWGCVPEADAKCTHEFDGGRNVGRCLHECTCTKCGKKQTVDSSD
jgi:hypothetical protein